MDWLRRNRWSLPGIVGGFLLAFWLPVEALAGSPGLPGPVLEALSLVRWYAREHVLLCLVPAFFIAGAIGVFVSQGAVLRYLGPRAPKLLAYGVASVSGSILAVCSCTVLPLFAGIYKMGAGLGPATAFLYSGPAINVLAIILTARVLGLELGVARAVGAVVFSVVIGLAMHLIFRRSEEARAAAAPVAAGSDGGGRSLLQSAIFVGTLVAVLVFATWGRPADATGFFAAVHAWKWWLTGAFGLLLAVLLVLWFRVRVGLVLGAAVPVPLLAVAFPGEPRLAFAAGAVGLSVVALAGGDDTRAWFESSWGFARQILPLLLAGVLVAGFLLGRPGYEGVVPAAWVSGAVGGNSLGANLFASVAGAFMYFATLTEVPILQGLLGNGMGQGPALALLLAGPALSLPNMLVIRSVLGTKRTVTYVLLVVVLATASGLLYGSMAGNPVS